MKRPPRATAWQISVALQYGIPVRLAYTVSRKKLEEYRKHCRGCNVDLWLDEQDLKWKIQQQAEWI